MKVAIADLKAHLSQYLRKVRSGRTLTIVHRNTPIARIVPVDAEAPLEVRAGDAKGHQSSAATALPDRDRQSGRATPGPRAAKRGRLTARGRLRAA